MNREELLEKLKGLEWNDIEVKEAKTEVPKSAWETVSSFSNTYGGWLIFGVKEKRKEGKPIFEIQGIENPEKIENDFIGVLRSNGKFNQRIPVQSEKFNFEGKIVLAFYIPMSEHKPVYIGIPANTYIRIGSGDQRATEYEIRAMQRDQAYGKKSNEVIFGSSFKDINQSSFQDFRSFVKTFNPDLSYNTLSDTDFAVKTGILSNGLLTIGGMLMFGKLESILRFNPDFFIDYLEIPGCSIKDANSRYSFRIQEQENIWEYYRVIFQRLRNYVDNPFSPRSDGMAPDDNSQLYCLRESLVNMLAHADYFSEIHSTVRVYYDHIEMQNAGGFPVNLEVVGKTIVSQPRNPNILRFFKLAKIAENGGYGIDKILSWKELTGCDVTIISDITKSEVLFNLPKKNINTKENVTGKYDTVNSNNDTVNGNNDTVNLTKREEALIKLIESIPNATRDRLAQSLGVSLRTLARYLSNLQKKGVIERVGSDKVGYWKNVKNRSDLVGKM